LVLAFLASVTSVKCSGNVPPINSASTCGPQQTIINEDERLCCYTDTRNIPTIGIGFNLQRSDAAQVMSKYNLTLADVLKDCTDKTTKHCLTDADARDIFNSFSYPEAETCVDAYSPGLPSVKRAAVIDVAFAGCAKLNKFVNMKAALQKQDWNAAAEELKNSLWCGQVGATRCNSDYNCIAGCKGQSCGSYTPCSSANPSCVCYKRSNGNSFCALPNLSCATDCSSCPESTSVCIVDSCCERPICVPLSAGSACLDSSSVPALKLNIANVNRLHCEQNTDCAMGAKCKQYAGGYRCG